MTPPPGGSLTGSAQVPESTRRIRARLDWSESGYRLANAEGTELVSGATIARERIHGGPWLLHLDDGWIFTTPAGLGPEAVPGRDPEDLIDRTLARLPQAVLVVLAAGALAWAGWRFLAFPG